MVTLEQCRTILGDYGKQLSNEELRELRDWLYVMAYLSNQADLKSKETGYGYPKESNSILSCE